MGNEDGGGRTKRFAAYLAELASVLGDARRHAAMISYCTGLLSPSERKSVEPMAALTAPTRTAAQHQSLLHFVGQGEWSDEAVMERILAYSMPRIEKHGAISAWIVDDTAFPKKGKHSVGVARQYCGQLGKQDNCQAAVSLSLANNAASLPVAYRLYLRNHGRTTASGGRKWVCRRTWNSGQNHRSRWNKSNGPVRQVCHAVWW